MGLRWLDTVLSGGRDLNPNVKESVTSRCKFVCLFVFCAIYELYRICAALTIFHRCADVGSLQRGQNPI